MLVGGKTDHISLRETLVLLVWRTHCLPSTKSETPFACKTTVSESLEVLHIVSEDLVIGSVNTFASPADQCSVFWKAEDSLFRPSLHFTLTHMEHVDNLCSAYTGAVSKQSKSAGKCSEVMLLEVKRTTLVYVKPWWGVGGPASAT